MSQTIVYILLLLALALPVLGAILLRVLGSRLTLAQFYVAAGGMFTLVLLSVLMLARSDVPSLQIGSLSVLLPASAPEDSVVSIPAGTSPLSGATLEEPTITGVLASTGEAGPTAQAAVAPTLESAPTVEPTQASTTAATEAPTLIPTEAPTQAPTEAPTAAPAPTEAPTPVPPAPTAAPAAPAPSEPRKYTVQPGDTLRSIAEQFKVSVPALLAANKLTPEQADSLRVGQELTIPTP